MVFRADVSDCDEEVSDVVDVSTNFTLPLNQQGWLWILFLKVNATWQYKNLAILFSVR